MNRIWQAIMKNGKGERNLVVLGVVAIIISLGLTTISIWVYQTGGAIQLDLSRPGYEPEVRPDAPDTTWGATGDLSDASIDEFLVIWDDEISRIGGDVFRPAPLSDESLGIERRLPVANPDASVE